MVLGLVELRGAIGLLPGPNGDWTRADIAVDEPMRRHPLCRPFLCETDGVNDAAGTCMLECYAPGSRTKDSRIWSAPQEKVGT